VNCRISESSNLWTHIALFGIPKSMPVSESFFSHFLLYFLTECNWNWIWMVTCNRCSRRNVALGRKKIRSGSLGNRFEPSSTPFVYGSLKDSVTFKFIWKTIVPG